MHTPPSPGQVLLEDYLKPMGISEKAMARAIGVSAATIRAIVSGKRSITPLMSIRIGTFFGHYRGATRPDGVVGCRSLCRGRGRW